MTLASPRGDRLACATLQNDARTVIGGSDAAAHVDLLVTFNHTTYLVAVAVWKWQILTLEDAVQMLTSDPAGRYGLRERGVLAPGTWAYNTAVDPNTVATEPVRTRWDLPDGAGRVYAGACEMEHVLGAGVPAVTSGERAGAMLRAGRVTCAPSLR